MDDLSLRCYSFSVNKLFCIQTYNFIVVFMFLFIYVQKKSETLYNFGFKVLKKQEVQNLVQTKWQADIHMAGG